MSYLEEFYNIMAQYRNKEFGPNKLSMFEILERSNNLDIFDKMSIDEMQHLIDHSTGITRNMFSLILEQKLKEN